MDYKLDKPVSNNESGVLAKLWRKIITENNYLPALDLLVRRYMEENDIAAGRIKNVKRKTKTTVVSNITATEMTFKTFLDLVFNLLKAKRLDISIKVTLHSGKESIHSISIQNVDISKVDKSEEEESTDGKSRS